MIDAAQAAKANHVTWDAHRPFVRGYSTGFPVKAFNPSPVVRRFRPVRDGGAVVATTYGAETGLIALAETVLRRAATRGSVIHRVELKGLGLVKASFPHDLDLIQLNGLGLRRLKLHRRQVIDSGPASYPATAELAQALYDAHPGAHGLVWTSRQSDDGDAFILWETRLDPDAMDILEGPIELDSAPGVLLVQQACEQLGIVLSP